ncbi:hypothetical protein G7084_01280 [Weissella coleopterorum]|uniref:Uncharacterized protein n=1 Tax=Weissella coleopterorum TaxID=2714949 RepID=A0A6G8AYM9_9LACO|nr:hypothetical protein [Weissella coleopterorum]QIL50069.1 hypothetical protein G7084_01280 [Weissella coleopterorum]
MTKYYSFNVVGNPSRLKGGCPGCENELTGTEDFCSNCGLYLINRCTGFSFMELVSATEFGLSNGNPLDTDSEWKIDMHVIDKYKKYSGCGAYCSGKSRHCPKCGSTTTFELQSMFDDLINKAKGTTAHNPYLAKIIKNRLS